MKASWKPGYGAGAQGQPYQPPHRDDEFSGFDFTLTVLASPFLIGWLLLRHWPATLPAVLLLWVWHTGGTAVLIVTAVSVAMGLLGWSIAHRPSFDRLLVDPYRKRMRGSRYRRVWLATMHNAKLTRGFGPERVAPRIVKMKLGRFTDKLQVQLLVGQGVDELHDATEALATTFGALSCQVKPDGSKPGRVAVHLEVRDRLAEVVAPVPAIEPVDTSRLTVGLRQDGAPWTIALTEGSHLLVGGETGSGKSSLLHAIFSAIGPLVRDGLAQVWAADPKGGMELVLAAPMCARFTYETGDMVSMVEDAEDLMAARANRHRGIDRAHVPTIDEPHVFLVLDELAGLTAYNSDRDATKRLNRALPHVLSMGRATGVTVIGAVQDPRKQVVDMRGLFTTRTAFRTSEADDVGMILTDGAHARGAKCEHISPQLRGVGYVETPDDDAPVRGTRGLPR